MKHISFIDTEVSEADNKAYDFGAVNENDDKLHTGSAHEFHSFISDSEYLCGHNIIEHDTKYIDVPENTKLIDTLYLSPLMFPNKPYHALLKDDKLLTDELNNPLNDAVKAKELFYDEVNAFMALDDELKLIYYMLLKNSPYFSAFFDYLDFSTEDDLETAIQVRFADEICENAPLSNIIVGSPVELAYCLALISATEEYSLIPRWVQINFPNVNRIMRVLRNTSCHECTYCRSRLNPISYLGKYFGYPGFRKYNDEPLQENAVTAAVEHKSLLAIFPTGGGKSLTFQIPALMAGETERALTVVISPLQSLMKDQVDNLAKRGIAEAVTINGLLSPIERAEAIERVESGIASILYISPESLRSVTILSAGKCYAPTRNHVTNYEIAQSHDRKVWDEYMKREDTIFLNCDEYCKTVIDYALEFKNYDFMKYLLEENFIWFVDNSKENYELYYYGADTSIKSNWDRFDMPDQFMQRKLYEEDKLRTQTAVLAIENGDCDVLDNLHAREIPELHDVTIWETDNLDFVKNRNDDWIEAIAASENEEILAYFSDEFPVQDRWKRENSLMFPFLNDVIKIMLDNNNKCAEFIIRKMIAHNKSTYEKTYSLIKEACQAEYNAIQKNKEKIIKEAYQNGISLADLKVTFKTEEVKTTMLNYFKFDKNTNVVSFFSGAKTGIATNIFGIIRSKCSIEIKQLVKELNECYNKIISLGGEKYAKILL